jgi:hypothetical protein
MMATILRNLQEDAGYNMGRLLAILWKMKEDRFVDEPELVDRLIEKTYQDRAGGYLWGF